MKKCLKVLSVLCMVAMISTAFIACGQQAEENEAQTSQSSTSEAKPVTLRFLWWGSDDRHQATLDAIALYKQKAPNVTIEAEYQGFDGYQQKLNTQLASGAAPDIIQNDSPWMFDYAARDVYVDLSQQPEIDITTFEENFLKGNCEFGGKLIGLPSGISGRTLIVNKTLADKAGLTMESNMTWDDLITQAKKLKTYNKDYYLLNTNVGVNVIQVMSIVKQKTGNQFIKDDYTPGFAKEDLVYALTWLKDAFAAGVFQPISESSLFADMNQNPKWINQEFVATEDWSSGVIKYQGILPKDTAAAVAGPAVLKDGKDGASIVRPSQQFSVNKKSVSIEESCKFLNWFLNDGEAAVILKDVRAVPASATARQAAGDAGKIDKNVIDAVELAQKNTQVTDNAPSSNTQITDIVKDVLQKLLFDKENVDQASAEIITRLEDKLKELKSAQK